MADININFGTEDLDGLRKLIAELQKAIETLRKGVQETGVITKETTEQAAKYTNAQKAATTEIGKRMKAIQAEEGSVLDLTQKYKLLKKEIDATAKPTKGQEEQLKRTKAALDAAKKSTNDWGVALESFQFKFNALGNIAANVLSQIGRYAKEFIKESILMAAATEGVRNAFVQLDKPGLLENLRKATRGAVADLSLMKAAVLAENFKIPLDQLATFLQYAGNQALRTGQDFDYLVDSIVRGLGRESVLVLDNLGLSAKELQDEAKKTGSFFEGAANVIQRDMARAGDVVDTTATKIARLTASISNLKVQTGKDLAPGIDLAAGSTSNFINKMTEAKVSIFDLLIPSQLFAKNIRNVLDDTYKLEQLYKDLSMIEMDSEGGPLESLSKMFNIKEIEDKGFDFKEVTENIYDDLLKTLQEYSDDQKKEDDNNLEDRKKGIEKKKELEIKSAKEISDILLELQKETDATFAELGKEGQEKANDEFITNLKNRTEAEIKADEDKERSKKAIREAAFDAAIALQNYLYANNEAKMNEELQQENLTEQQKDDIRKKYARKGQNIAVGEAIANTAVGIAKALGLPFPASLIVGALYSGIGALQVATIKAQKFKKGGEITFGDSHERGGSIIEAERGEFVVKKSAYQKNKELVNAINAEDSYKIAIAMRQDKGQSKQEKNYTKELYDWMKKQPVFGESPEYFIRIENGVERRYNKQPKN